MPSERTAHGTSVTQGRCYVSLNDLLQYCAHGLHACAHHTRAEPAFNRSCHLSQAACLPCFVRTQTIRARELLHSRQGPKGAQSIAKSSSTCHRCRPAQACPCPTRCVSLVLLNLFSGCIQSGKTKGTIVKSMTNIYQQEGWLAFWNGNGANTLKIMPESAMRFLGYEMFKTRICKVGQR